MTFIAQGCQVRLATRVSEFEVSEKRGCAVVRVYGYAHVVRVLGICTRGEGPRFRYAG